MSKREEDLLLMFILLGGMGTAFGQSLTGNQNGLFGTGLAQSPGNPLNSWQKAVATIFPFSAPLLNLFGVAAPNKPPATQIDTGLVLTPNVYNPAPAGYQGGYVGTASGSVLAPAGTDPLSVTTYPNPQNGQWYGSSPSATDPYDYAEILAAGG